MTQEDKNILLKDLCARIPYRVKFQGEDSNVYTLDAANYFALQVEDMVFKPYLRPMSSMTEEEKNELNAILPCSMSFAYTTKEELIIYTDSEYDGDHYFSCFVEIQDWLNAHHFDYRGLIDKGLALEAPADMYKTE